MSGPDGKPNFRYVITVDDDAGARLTTQGFARREDAQLAYANRISAARSKFDMPNDELPRLDTRSDRRAGVLFSVKVGPETITLRHRNRSDKIPSSAVKSSEPVTTEQIVTYTVTALIFGGILVYGGVSYGYKSAINFVLWIVGFFAVIGAVAFGIGAAGRGVSALRKRLMTTESGRRVEFVARRGLFYTYAVLITPVIVVIIIAGAISMVGQFIDIWIVTPLQLLAVVVSAFRALGHWISNW